MLPTLFVLACDIRRGVGYVHESWVGPHPGCAQRQGPVGRRAGVGGRMVEVGRGVYVVRPIVSPSSLLFYGCKVQM